MSKVRVGVIGVGAFGEVHLAAYKTLHDVEIVAISDTRESRLREVAAKFDVKNCYADYKELCARKDIDLVSVVTPEAHHLAPVLAAVGQGKHIFLEKPIATRVKDAEQIMEAAEKAGVFLMVGHILRFENNYGTMKRKIEEGKLGDIVSVHARRNRPRKLYRTYSREHAIIENSIHDIDICLWYTQAQVENVRAFTRNIQGGVHPDINWCFLEFKGGAVACLETHWLIPDVGGIGTDDSMQIIGTKGVADLHFIPAGLNFWTEDGVEAANVTYDAWFNNQIWGAAKEEASYIVDCVRKGAAPTMIKPVEALDALKVALACVSSAQTGRDVTLGA